MIKAKIQKLDNLTKIWFELKRYLIEQELGVIELYIQSLEKSLNRWEKAVKFKNNQPIPKKYLHKRRPFNRKFTYKVSGEQYKSIRAKLIKERLNKGHITIRAWAEIGVPYALYTDLAKPKRNDGKIPAWKNWVYDILFDKGRSGITSVNDIFENVILGLEKEFE